MVLCNALSGSPRKAKDIHVERGCNVIRAVFMWMRAETGLVRQLDLDGHWVPMCNDNVNRVCCSLANAQNMVAAFPAGYSPITCVDVKYRPVMARWHTCLSLSWYLKRIEAATLPISRPVSFTSVHVNRIQLSPVSYHSGFKRRWRTVSGFTVP